MADLLQQGAAAGIRPPDPNAGIQTLSGILGLQQQRQAIGISGQQLQQEQLKTQQQQGIQSFFQAWNPDDHLAPDGTTDADSVHASAAYKNAGNAKPLIDQTLLQIKQGQLQNKQALATLDSGLVDQYARTMGSLADDPDVKQGGINGQAKVNAALQQFSQLQPEAQRVAGIFGGVLQRAPIDPETGNSKNLGHLVQSQQLMGADVLGQRGQQNPGQLIVPRGGTTDIYNVNKATGLQPGQQPAKSVSTTIPPNYTLINGQLVRADNAGLSLPPVRGSGTQASGALGQPGAQPKLQAYPQPPTNADPGVVQRYRDQMAANQKHVQDVSEAANDTQNGVGAARYRNDQIKNILQRQIANYQPNVTGPGSDTLHYIASHFSDQAGTDYDTIRHYLAQNSASMAGKMGVPNTNAGQETAAAGAGSTAQVPKALLEVTKQNDAMNTAYDMYNRGLSKISNNGADPSKVSAYRQAFGQNFDTNVFRYDDAIEAVTGPKSITTDETRAERLEALAAKRKVLHSLSDTGDLP